MNKLHAIPCNVITGFLGVGKTTCILNLLQQKPKSERWAILVNEFGEIGIDGQLIENTNKDQPNIFIREVPGGCMCCRSGLPMQIALNLLLMKAKPDRVLIEPTGLGHPKEVLKVLSGEHFQQVLSLENTLTLVNPQHFSNMKHLQNKTFQQQLEVADLIVANKTDLSKHEDIENLKYYLSTSETLKNVAYRFTEKGAIPLELLNRTRSLTQALHSFGSMKRVEHKHHAPDTQLPPIPECGYLIEQHKEDGFISMGWRISHTRIFDLALTLDWFAQIDALRIKALMQTGQGWAACNISKEFANDIISKKQIPDYQLVAPPTLLESRMEMIFECEKFSKQRLAAWKDILDKRSRHNA